jgi:amino acid permease
VNVFAIYDELASPSPRRMAQVSSGAVYTCFVAYLLMGTFGYMDFGQSTAGNVLLNYCVEKSRDPLMISAFVCIVITIVMAFPLNIFPCRYTLEVALDRRNTADKKSDRASAGETLDDFSDATSDAYRLEESSPLDPLLPGSGSAGAIPKSRARHFLVTLLISGSSLLIALVVPNISVVFELMGGTASSFVCFVMPAAFGIKLNLGEGKGPLFNGGMWALAVGGAAIGFLSTGVTIYGIFVPEAKTSVVC